MSEAGDLYLLLCVTPDAEATEIRAAYRRLAWERHPDVGGSHRAMTALNGAWQILRDPNARAHYDIRRKAADDAAAAPPGAPPDATAPGSAAHPTFSSAPEAVGDESSRADALRGDPLAGLRATPQSTDGRATGAGRCDGSTVLDFGRYEGWSLIQLATADPDYLEWLARTSIGRRLQPEIAALLAARRANATLRPRSTRLVPRAADRWARVRRSVGR